MKRYPAPLRPLPAALLTLSITTLATPALEAQQGPGPMGGDRTHTLPTISVQARGERETATSPVSGFRARRAGSATKTDTPLAETPQSVSVITRDQITETGMSTLQDVLGYAAGVRSDAYGIDSRADSVRVRGSNVDSYRDGLRDTYNWYTSTTRPDPYTLERIEVLRGPASMLFGAGDVGGVVNLVSKRPQFAQRREVGVQLGSHRRRQAQFDLTAPLSEQLAWRLVGVIRKSDTQVEHVPDDRAVLMPALTWQPDAATSLTVHGLYQKDRTGSTAQFFPWAGTLLPAAPGTLPTSRFIGEPGDHYDSERTQFGWNLEHKLNAAWTIRQNYRHSRNLTDTSYHYGDFFTLVGGWSEDPVNQRILGRMLSSQRVSNHMNLVDTHVQGTLTTGSVQHTLLAGLDYIRQKEDVDRAGGSSTIDAWAPVYGQWTRPTVRTPDKTTGQRQLGAYVQDQVRWHDWLLVAGLRHDRSAASVAEKDDARDHATTKRLGLMYLTASQWNPYLSYAESFKPVEPNRGQTFKPLRGQLKEIGVKYEPAGQSLAFNAAPLRPAGKEPAQVHHPRAVGADRPHPHEGCGAGGARQRQPSSGTAGALQLHRCRRSAGRPAATRCQLLGHLALYGRAQSRLLGRDRQPPHEQLP